ncbi:MAG TPA: diguanylate cyclase [Candidatus Sulfotelmatobacter sp.]|nr:diguanylate cyclase [Candidatus Sulfotelmatobacter sp.]
MAAPAPELIQDVLFNQISDAVFATDPDNRVTYWSGSAERLFGYEAKDAVGRLFGELLPFRMAEAADEQRLFTELGAGRTWRGSGTVTRPDGRVMWIESTIQPIITDGRLVGSVSVSRDISAAVEAQARLADQEQALRDRVRLFAAFTVFAGVANAILDPIRLAAALADAVGAVVPSDTIVITIRDHSDGRYRVQAARGLTGDVVGTLITPGDGNTGRALEERTIVTSHHHARSDFSSALRSHVPFEALYGIAVPLIRDESVLGVISLGRAGDGATFSDAELEIIGLLGAQAALALANAFLVEEVSALAIHDGLTGLFNRRHFDAALDLAIARYRRHRPPGALAAIMFDLDHFGRFNRRHGHLAGDAELRLVGDVLRQHTRSSDIVARYGGEEFVAILEDASLDDAVRVADAIRRDLMARSVRGPRGRPVRATVSAGCASIDPTDPTREALIGAADGALFQAKRAGRNRVVAA